MEAKEWAVVLEFMSVVEVMSIRVKITVIHRGSVDRWFVTRWMFDPILVQQKVVIAGDKM